MKHNILIRFLYIILMFCILNINLHSEEAVLTEIKGKISIFSQATKTWKQAKTGNILKGLEKIKSGSNSSCILIFQSGNQLKIGPNTEIDLSELNDKSTELKLNKGYARAKVKKLTGMQKFNIKTPTALCSIRGTDFSVQYENNSTKLEVYEGIVSAKEETTGKEILVNPGQYSVIDPNKEPTPPEPITEDKKNEKTETQTKEEQAKQEAMKEIVQEISREEVMDRAAEEIKMAEFQNGKALVDAFGKRVRLEEYIIRPLPNQFKYVVLNTREDRFDFGKIYFSFNKDLPTDLTVATKNMFYKEGETKPDWYLTSVDSVLSNTYDKVIEEVSGGNMIYDTLGNSWSSFFSSYKFYIGNKNSTENDGKGFLKWKFSDLVADGGNEDNVPQAQEFTYYYKDPAGVTQKSNSLTSSIITQPLGSNIFYFRQKDIYPDNSFVQADDYIIDDNGKILDTSKKITSADFYKLNFERSFTATEFEGRKIDLVFSAKLLIDSGMLSVPQTTSSSISSLRRAN